MRGFFRRFYLAIILIFLYAPILTLIVFSFNESKSMAHWGGFSLKWYGKLFTNSTILDAIFVTMSIAVLASLIATVIGTFAAIGINNFKKRPKSFMMSLSYIPMVNADIVTGISMLLLFILLQVPRGYFTLLIAHITFCLPYTVLSVLPRLKAMDTAIYEAALDMGATPRQAILRVVLPDIMPGIVTGLILAFTLSFDDFVISFFTTQGMLSNLSIYIYSTAKMGVKPEINALSAIMFVVVMLLLIIINKRSPDVLAAQKQTKNRRSNGDSFQGVN
jgi:spermidine/putrescine transport system permease protein